jgi:hypothetical protein
MVASLISDSVIGFSPIDLTLPAALWLLRFTQNLTDMSTRNLLGVKCDQPARTAENLTVISELIV